MQKAFRQKRKREGREISEAIAPKEKRFFFFILMNGCRKTTKLVKELKRQEGEEEKWVKCVATNHRRVS